MHSPKIVRKFIKMVCFVFIIFAVAMTEPIVVPSTANPTIGKALQNARSGDTVIVENGVYNEKVRIKPGVFLQARSQFKAIIDGNGKGSLVALMGNAGICGFEIRSGTIGIESNNIDNTIQNCRITSMTETGISCSGPLPKIEDNIIVYNKGSGIVGWNIQTTTSAISHNTIAFNMNNGVGLGGTSIVTIENNIIAYNQRAGVKINGESVTTQMTKNVFFQNGSVPYIKLEGNSICDPKFKEPKKMDFSLQADSPCKPKGLNEEVPGARSGM
jgi:hypothetical protein